MSVIEIINKKLQAAPPEVAREVLDFLEFLEAKAERAKGSPAVSFDAFFGSLRDSAAFQGDPVEIQRVLRDEWGS